MNSTSVFVAAAVLSSLASAAGQDAGTSGAVLLAMANNVKQLVQYEWKQRITVTRKGKPAQPVIDQVHFDSGGQLQRATISAPPQETGGIRGRIAAEVRQNVKELMTLAASYNKPQQMAAYVKKAQISQSTGAGTMRLHGNDVIASGDTMVMLVDSNVHLPTHVEIKTTYDGGPITITQDYGPVPGGPNVMKTMNVSAPKKDLAIRVDSYDYVQQAAGAK